MSLPFVFQGKNIDLVVEKQTILITLSDLAKTIGLLPSKAKEVVIRNFDEFKPCIYVKKQDPYKGFVQPISLLKYLPAQIFINEEGVYSYLMLSRTEKGMEFRMAFSEFLRKVRIGELQVSHNPLQEQTLQELSRKVLDQGSRIVLLEGKLDRQQRILHIQTERDKSISHQVNEIHDLGFGIR